MTEKRKKAIIRRRIFICMLAVLLALLTALIAVIVAACQNGQNNGTNNSSVPFASSQQDEPSSDTDVGNASSTFTTPTGVTLDTNFKRLLLINADNPLPDDYDANVRDYLVEIDEEYRNNNNVTQIHSDVYPYITAMVAAAEADGVDLRVWSPFRSYAVQNDLFQKQVKKAGGDEQAAATVVARPGTSEHNTGLCADFNMASDTFESTPMYKWMCENAENYGFVLRYPKDKQNVTGVIYESWHWRFVGINTAKEMNDLGLTLEEYVKLKNIDPASDMYGDDSAK